MKKHVRMPGHCKHTADRLHVDAGQIASRLAGGKTVKALAAEYDCHAITMCKHVRAVIGARRWRQLIPHRGPQPGEGVQPLALLSGKPPIEAGFPCFWCSAPTAEG